jgi:hypothetical protein
MKHLTIQEAKEFEEIQKLFQSKVNEAIREAGIREVNHIPDGFEFGYKGKKIEIKIKIK